MNVSKAVLITGCSSGIGWATAERLVDVGWRVYATARSVEKIAPLQQRGCELLPLDVTDEDSRRIHLESSSLWVLSSGGTLPSFSGLTTSRMALMFPSATSRLTPPWGRQSPK